MVQKWSKPCSIFRYCRAQSAILVAAKAVLVIVIGRVRPKAIQVGLLGGTTMKSLLNTKVA